jgi:hypothetical protein
MPLCSDPINAARFRRQIIRKLQAENNKICWNIRQQPAVCQSFEMLRQAFQRDA